MKVSGNVLDLLTVLVDRGSNCVIHETPQLRINLMLNNLIAEHNPVKTTMIYTHVLKLLGSSIILLSLVLAPETYVAQEMSKPANGCVVKDPVKPSIFISYEAATGPGNDRTKTLLRLQNNTNCTIVIETSDLVNTPDSDKLFKKITKGVPDGSLATTYIPDPAEGAFLPVYYDKQRTMKYNPQPANYWEYRDLCFEYDIPSGRSITFAVDATLFQKRFFISVPFRYDWEHPRELVTLGTIQHRVYYVYELPTGYYVPPK